MIWMFLEFAVLWSAVDLSWVGVVKILGCAGGMLVGCINDRLCWCCMFCGCGVYVLPSLVCFEGFGVIFLVFVWLYFVIWLPIKCACRLSYRLLFGLV